MQTLTDIKDEIKHLEEAVTDLKQRIATNDFRPPVDKNAQRAKRTVAQQLQRLEQLVRMAGITTVFTPEHRDDVQLLTR